MVAAAPPRGFTLIELMVVLAMLAVVVFLSVGVASNGFSKHQLSVETEQIVSTLRQAQTRSLSRHEGDVWSVRITSTGYTLYLGDDYDARNTAFDEAHVFPEGITATGLSEVLFDFRTGMSSTPGTITLTQGATGDARVVNIATQGMISY